MCMRFYVEPAVFRPYIDRAKRLPLADQIIVSLGKPLTMSGELYPTDVAAVLAPDKSGGIGAFPMLWGFTVPETGAPVVNCRLESADYKPLWKDSWYRRRCVIPVSWYYEWEHFASPDGKRRMTGAKYAVQPEGADVTWLAGLYRFETHGGIQVPVFAVITRPADENVSALHDRMPLILDRECIADWIRPDGNPNEIAKKASVHMMTEKVLR